MVVMGIGVTDPIECEGTAVSWDPWESRPFLAPAVSREATPEFKKEMNAALRLGYVEAMKRYAREANELKGTRG